MREFIEKIIRESTQRLTYFRISDDNILDSEFSAKIIVPHDSYFQVRLCELFLCDKRQYWGKYIPLSIAVSDFLYGQSRQTAPFFVGNQLLHNLETHLKGQYIDFRNTRIAGPIPYLGDDFGLFIGLFRLKVGDLIEDMFRVVEKIVTAFDSTSLTRYLDIAKPLGEGLSSLLGVQGNELRFGVRDVFTDIDDDSHQFRQGYLAYINCQKKDLPGKIFVRDNRLFAGPDKNKIKPFGDYDYCLIKIECFDHRKDYPTFPFYQLWKKTDKLLRAGNEPQARWKLSEMFDQIADSPDLTITHRENLIKYFTVEYYKKIQSPPMSSITKQGRKTVATRSGKTVVARNRGDHGSDNGRSISLQRAAIFLNETGQYKKSVKKIMDLHTHWSQLTGSQDITDDSLKDDQINNIINQQLTAINKIHKSKKPNPRELADALTLFNTNA